MLGVDCRVAEESHGGTTSQQMGETLFDRGDLERPDSDGAPSKVGRYVLLEEIGCGAMGVVYSAYDSDLDRKIAVKLLHRGERGDHRARLHREAQAMAKISHPNVVHVYEVGLHEDRVYLAMEFIDGMSLRQWLKQHEPSRDEIIRVFLAAGRGLAQAHRSDLVHRDFKPDNVLVDHSGAPRVVDFGLARTIGETEEITSFELADNQMASASGDLTLTGAVLGTPAYMSPEQFIGETATAASDQFSFCVALWQALCGERPFRGKDPVSLAFQVRSGKRRPMPAAANVPASLRRALERGLAVDPADRWPSMEALLEAITPKERGRIRPVALVAGLTLLVGAGAGAAIALSGGDQDPCEMATAELGSVWNESRRAEVHRALVAAGPGYAESVASRIDAELDAYAAEWSQAAQDSCQATHVRDEQSEHMLELQRECLGQRLSALDGLASEFESADEAVLERASQATAALPSLETCRDSEILLSATPPPEDPEVAKKVSEIRREHAAISATLNTGRYAEALTRLRALEKRAEGLDYAPVVAEVAVDVASAIEATETGDVVIEALERAFALGVEAGDAQVATRSATLLGGSLGYRDQRFEAGLAWLTVARAYLPALTTGRFAAEADIEDAEGTIAFRQVQYDEAAAAFERAAELYAEGDDELSELSMRGHKAVVLITRGDVKQGGAIMREVTEKTAEVLGDNHPAVGVLTQNLAAVANRMGEPERALELYERAIEIAEASRGRKHPSYSVPLSAIATILFRQGRNDEARERAEMSRELLEASGTVSADCAEPYLVLGRIDLAEGALVDARENVEKANAILEETVGDQHPMTAAARTRLAEIEMLDGNHKRAIELLTRAIEHTQPHQGAREAGDAYFMRAKLHAAMEEPDTAREWAEKALDWFERVPAAADPSSEIRAWQAENLD